MMGEAVNKYDYKKWDKPRKGHCDYEWFEKSNRFTAEGNAPNRWNDQRQNPTTRDSFASWDEGIEQAPCPGKLTIQDTDTPGMGVMQRGYRSLEFGIRVTSASGCNCPIQQETRYLQQQAWRIRIDGEWRQFADMHEGVLESSLPLPPGWHSGGRRDPFDFG
jgi:hypothetical protein